MLGFDFWYTAIIIVLMTTFLILEKFEAEIVVFSTLTVLILGGVIDVKEAFAGYSNDGMLTVGLLFVVAGAMQKTGAFSSLGNFFLGRKDGKLSLKLLRFMFPVSAISAFFNNTPVVAMLIPVVTDWAKKHNVSSSKLLIPLSYATILGGIGTLIGTSTNLVVHGLMLDNGMRGIGFFEISKIGIPVTIGGLFWIALAGHRFLPDRKELVAQLGENTREFVVAMKVESNYGHIGKSIENAGLRHLKGLFLFQVERNNELIAPAAPEETICLNDRLFFTGLPETIVELQKTPGLKLLDEAELNLKDYDSDHLGAFEVVVSPNSPLIGQNVRDSNFRRVYDAVILAVHRSGERIRQKIGDIVMESGDTMLLMAKRSFLEKWYHSKDFYLVSRSVEVASKPRRYFYFSFGVLIMMILAMATGVIPILLAVCIAAAILVISGCISAADARNSVDLKVLVIIASSFGISKALSNSGVASFLAGALIDAFGSFGVIGLLASIYLITTVYTEFITNNAAAAIVFPIALSMTTQADIDPRPFMIAIAVGASASFSTPIGYQTNLMVYGPGGYKFTDFMKIGVPMNIVVGVIAVSIIYLCYF